MGWEEGHCQHLQPLSVDNQRHCTGRQRAGVGESTAPTQRHRRLTLPEYTSEWLTANRTAQHQTQTSPNTLPTSQSAGGREPKSSEHRRLGRACPATCVGVCIEEIGERTAAVCPHTRTNSLTHALTLSHHSRAAAANGRRATHTRQQHLTRRRPRSTSGGTPADDTAADDLESFDPSSRQQADTRTAFQKSSTAIL